MGSSPGNCWSPVLCVPRKGTSEFRNGESRGIRGQVRQSQFSCLLCVPEHGANPAKISPIASICTIHHRRSRPTGGGCSLERTALRRNSLLTGNLTGKPEVLGALRTWHP